MVPATLGEIHHIYSDKRACTMKYTISLALANHSLSARCVISSGAISHSRNSNAFRAAKAAGFPDYKIYVAARAGRYRNDGYVLLIVETPLGEK